MTSIPLVDLRAQHQQVAEEIEAGWRAVLDRTAFVLGDEVRAFEEAFAGYSEVAHCVGVANGTDALELALRAVGVGSGDEVILPANTFMATALAVLRAGARPVLVDVDATTYLIDPDRVAAAIGPRTRALMPVHLFGQVCRMEGLAPLAAEAGLVVVEDAAQAQGARRHGRTAGGFGVVAGTSFYPGKNLGAYGDAGAVLTDDAEVAQRIRALRNYGSETKYHHPVVGFNSRLDTLQAVVLNVKLRHLERWNQARREAAIRYEELLADLWGVQLPTVDQGNEAIWHLYVVRVPRRDEVLATLHEHGIGAGIHYPVPVHLQGACADLGYRRGDFPVTEEAADQIVSLPMFAEITAEQQEQVAEVLRKALR